MTSHPAPRGFTIIEVMLFLAITGLMIAGVLAAVSGSLNQQRYQDANASLTDFIQGQYNLVDNVNTNRPASVECQSTGFALGGGQSRGTSNCTIIGRYVTSVDGRRLTSRPVYALTDVASIDPDDYTTEKGYIDLLNLAMTDLYDGDDQQYTVAWNTYVYTEKASPAASRDFTILLLRLPTNGLIRTYAVGNGDVSLDDTVTNSVSDAFTLCVATDGMVASPPLGLKIMPLAANTSGVQPVTGSEGVCS